MRPLLITFVMVFLALPVAAAPDFTRPGPQNIVGETREAGPRVGSKEAASRVKRAYGDRKILSVRLIDAKGPPVYRVKTLSDDGVVEYVFVDGTSGDVFE